MSTKYTKGFPFKSQDYRNDGIRIIRVSDLGSDFIRSDNDKIYISSASAGDYERYKLRSGEIIITTVGSKPEMVDSAVGRGIFLYANNQGLLNQNLLKLEVMAGINSRFLFSHINTKKYQKFIASISRGNANQANIAVKDLMDFKLQVPSIAEQQKIAECLSSVDEAIAAQARKLDALKTHKKGLMQQLFPREGETQPRLRFPEFQGKGGWRETRLGDISDIKTGPFGSMLHQSDYVATGTPIVTVEHLSDQGLIHKNLPLVSDDDKWRLASYVLRDGDIVFSRVGSVDRNSLVGKKEDGWLFSGRLLRIRTQASVVSPKFLSFYFQLETTKQKIRSVAVGQTMASLNTEILNEIQIVTAALPEQKKIAECLSSVDKAIAAATQKLEALKTHKRGLMQQLFPIENCELRSEKG